MKSLLVSKPFTYYGTTILGGWTAEIPTAIFDPDDRVMMRYAREFQRIGGVKPHEGFRIAEQACQRIWETHILASVKRSVGWHAKAYEDSFGELLGFDASRVGEKYVPYVPKFYGKGGIPTMRALMASMRAEVT